MNIEQVKSLAEIFTAHSLTFLEVNEGGTKIRLEKDAAASVAAAPSVISAPAQTVQEAIPDDLSVDFNHLTEIKSPMVGVFYSAPTPDSEPFVSIGSKVKKGDVICIIEAMKLMNEITADNDGEIVDICIKNGDIAEFGQVLFKMF